MDDLLISAVLIVRNEQDRLPTCLEALAPVADEIIVVDTGSSDRTREVAQSLTERVYQVAWGDDFAAARNAAIAYARGTWVLTIDADEVIEGGANTRALLVAFTEAHPPNTVGNIYQHQMDDGTGVIQESVDHIERFFHRTTFRYEGAIHEQLVPISGDKRHADTSVHVLHSGYAHKVDDPRHKSHRNIPLLIAAIEAQPDDEYLYFQLGKAHYALKQYEPAAHAFAAALERMRFHGNAMPEGRVGTVSRSVLTGCLVNLAYAYINLGRGGAALQLLDHHAALGHAATRWADFCHVYGYVHLMTGDIARSRLAYETSLALGPDREDVRGTGTFASRYHLGLLAEAEGNYPSATEQYAAALALRPAYLPALARGISWVIEGRPREAVKILAQAEPAQCERLYIDRFAQCLQNGSLDDAQRLRAAARDVSDALASALAAWEVEMHRN